jgi:hypothetical protein
MIFWGTLATQFERPRASWLANVSVWGIASIGMVLALRVFMADALRVSDQGVDAIRNVLPERFDWSLFGLALVLMSAPIGRLLLPNAGQSPKRIANLKVAENV